MTSAGGSSEYANGVQLKCVNGATVTAANVVFCAGAYADRLARKSGGEVLFGSALCVVEVVVVADGVRDSA